MTESGLLKRIKTQKWWVEESPASVFLFNNISKSFTQGEAITGYPNLKEMFTIYKNGTVFEISPYQGKINNFNYFLERELKQPGFTIKKFKPWTKLIQKDLLKLNNIALNELGKLNTKQLLKYTKELIKLTTTANIYAVMIECVDPFSEKWEKQFKKKYKLKPNYTKEDLVLLSLPWKESFLTKEKTDFLKLCLKKITPKSYLKKWYWINTNYQKSKDTNLSELKKMVKDEISQKSKLAIIKEIKNTSSYQKTLIKQKKELITKISLTKKERTTFKLLEIFGHFIDIRKESMLKYSYNRDRLLKEIGRRTKLPLQTLRNMRDEEVLKILNNKKINLDIIKSRNSNFTAYYTPKKEYLFHGKSAQKFYQTYIKSLKVKILKGQVASAPIKKIKGKVSLVLDVNKDKFKSGSILVTTMTRPEFMPLIRKAKAVITDEGGVTCHAAIVSRELNIPCIIGTKIATKILNDGDMVELNTNTGSIKIIK